MTFRDHEARERAHQRFHRRQAELHRNHVTRNDWQPPNLVRIADWRLARARHENRQAMAGVVIRY